eukprot:scaffold238547_cov17-Tisochrysis_lutea.AAC.1
MAASIGEQWQALKGKLQGQRQGEALKGKGMQGQQQGQALQGNGKGTGKGKHLKAAARTNRYGQRTS